MEKVLKQLLSGNLQYQVLQGDLNMPVKGIAHNSRKVRDGFLFVCIRGFKDDGHNYIDDAYERGARVFLVEKEISPLPGSTVIKTDNTRQALGKVAASFYDYPSEGLTLIGVTGTNGKTTTTHMVNNILKAAGYKTGLIGTINNEIGGRVLPSTRTTPDSLDLQQLLAQMKKDGVSHVVMEVSSHALELDRVIGCRYRVAVFTNLTQDHLDFHRDLQKYFKAKIKLFKFLLDDTAGVAVVNIDDQYGSQILETARKSSIAYGLQEDAELRGEDIRINPGGVSFTARFTGGRIPLNLKLTGKFNVYNALAATGTALALGIAPEKIKEGLEGLKGVAGRFELVDFGQNFTAIVDFAHTPDGLENILRTARELTTRRIIVVFGCGGDRDRDKRPKMGKIAGELADMTIITSDNPRSEEPLDIIRDIEEGIRQIKDVEYLIVPDRKKAIHKGVEIAGQDDILIVVGKGHETYQEIKGKRYPFNDREVIERAIKKTR